VQPVPDPDAPAADEPRSSEPELNHPRDLTAQAPVRRTWAYTPVSWAKGPAKQDQVIAPVVHATSAAAQQKQEVIWDASGWKSIAK
jgi:hypothetical protein